MTRFATIFGAIIVVATFASQAHAQYKPKARPFDTYNKKPAVSPYLNLVNNNNGIATNYQSLVRPQMEQMNYNQRAASAIGGLQNQNNGLTPQAPRSGTEGNQKLRPTGHQSLRQSYSHYYPGFSR